MDSGSHLHLGVEIRQFHPERKDKNWLPFKKLIYALLSPHTSSAAQNITAGVEQQILNPAVFVQECKLSYS